MLEPSDHGDITCEVADSAGDGVGGGIGWLCVTDDWVSIMLGAKLCGA